MKDDNKECLLHGRSNEITALDSDIERVASEKSTFDGTSAESASHSQSTEVKTGTKRTSVFHSKSHREKMVKNGFEPTCLLG